MNVSNGLALTSLELVYSWLAVLKESLVRVSGKDGRHALVRACEV